MKEKIIRAINYRAAQIINNGVNNAHSKIEIRLIKIATNTMWATSLFKTSLTVTKTPLTTLKSIMKTNLKLKNVKPQSAANNQHIRNMPVENMYENSIHLLNSSNKVF